MSAAVAAGMRVVATVSHYTADEDLTAADIVVDGLGEPDGAAIAVYKNDTKQRSKLMSLWSTSPGCWVNQGAGVERP